MSIVDLNGKPYFTEPVKKKGFFSKLKIPILSLFFAGMLGLQYYYNNQQTERIRSIDDRIQTQYVAISKEAVEKADHVLVVKDTVEENIESFLADIEAPNVNDIALVVDKTNQEMSKYRLAWIEEDKYTVSTGFNQGDKQYEGDMRTPEGIFPINQVQNSINWAYEGVIGAYGPKFIRLFTPGWDGIGIHGTNEPENLGEPTSHGCVRMDNEKVEELSKDIKLGTSVMIHNGKLINQK